MKKNKPILKSLHNMVSVIDYKALIESQAKESQKSLKPYVKVKSLKK